MTTTNNSSMDSDLLRSVDKSLANPMSHMSLGKEATTDFARIPDRMFFRIGDVAEIAGIKAYVLRFWEKEFDLLSPIKNSAGQRIYRRSDVEAVLLIKRLLYMERFSIEGARKRIKELRKDRKLGEAKRERGSLDDRKITCVEDIRKGLSELIMLASR